MLHGMVYARQAEHLEFRSGQGFCKMRFTPISAVELSLAGALPHSLPLLSRRDLQTCWRRLRNGDATMPNVMIDTRLDRRRSPPVASLRLGGFVARKRHHHVAQSQRQEADLWARCGESIRTTGWAPRKYQARSPWLKDRDRKAVSFIAGAPKTLTLAPFEVLNLEALPEK